MKLGIVGSEAAKFTPDTEAKAKLILIKLIQDVNVSEVISGGCHLGGIDIWAVEVAKDLNVKFTEFLPKFRSWEGYKARNLQIAKNSDKVVCITLKELPPTYTGMCFPFCYHCKTDTHVKSGGCWTMKKAAEFGKETQLIVI